jgi:1-phosphatidylinositol-3-phosphate 5-kinase
VLKAVKGSEVKMFEDMSGSYFDYLKESFARQCPSTIAKTLGIFKIKIRLEKQSRSEQFYLLLMENLLIHSNENCVRYDLKGSRRNRYISKKSPNEVTLDNNFLQDMKSRPIPLQYSMKRLLTLAIHNDSLYLSKQSIIDYSMFVIIDK